MKTLVGRILLTILLCFAFGLLCAAQQPEPPWQRDPAKEAPILQELQKTAPKAVERFKLATENLDKQNYPDAISQFNEVLKLAPNFEPAMRRLSYCLVSTGK